MAARYTPLLLPAGRQALMALGDRHFTGPSRLVAGRAGGRDSRDSPRRRPVVTMVPAVPWLPQLPGDAVAWARDPVGPGCPAAWCRGGPLSQPPAREEA